MKTIKTIINIIGLLLGIIFIFSGGSDIQLGFGALMILVSLNALL